MDIFGMEKLSLVDYDGKVACTLFTGACNFRCGFCHNAPLVTKLDRSTLIDNEEIFAFLKKRQGIIEGVCVSGGEPTLQKDLIPFIEKIKSLGYSVKLDTNGTNPEIVKQLHQSGLVDYFAVDIKNDKASYSEIIGVNGFSTEKLEKTVDYLISNVDDYEFRTTLINEYHSAENMKKIGEWIKGAKKYRLQKFIPSSNCIAQGLTEVDEETAKQFVAIVKPYVENTALRSY